MHDDFPLVLWYNNSRLGPGCADPGNTVLLQASKLNKREKGKEGVITIV